MKRENGYYWCFGVSWHDVKHWAIYWWDGNYFWNGDEDLGEESIEKIDEKQIVRNEQESKPKN